MVLERSLCEGRSAIDEALPSLSSFIFTARSDASFIAHTLPGLFQMLRKANSTPHVVVDATTPGGVLGKTLLQTQLSGLLDKLNSLQEEGHLFEIDQFSPDPKEVQQLSSIHFGAPYRETHCFRGYPIHGSIRQFHQKESDYVLHLDCDMLFYEDDGFSWINEGVKMMEENEDILCVLPRGGPPTSDGNLHQGTTHYKKDDSRGVYLFKNFTSRHYLIHRKRFLNLLPMKPTWLSWREPIKSRLFGSGKMLCWETTVEKALEESSLWRADLMTDKAWSLHPGERSKEFHEKIPSITKQVAQGHFPTAQAGHFDLRLGDWEVN
jgi:hypothetical protein